MQILDLHGFVVSRCCFKSESPIVFSLSCAPNFQPQSIPKNWQVILGHIGLRIVSLYRKRGALSDLVFGALRL